jgi:hypothetical protein
MSHVEFVDLHTHAEVSADVELLRSDTTEVARFASACGIGSQTSGAHASLLNAGMVVVMTRWHVDDVLGIEMAAFRKSLGDRVLGNHIRCELQVHRMESMSAPAA